MLYLIALLSGLIYFFSVCLISTFPIYVSFLTGTSLKDGREKPRQWRLFFASLFFILGMILVFLFLGLGVSSLSIFLVKNRMIISRIGGALLVLLGLYLISGLKILWLNREYRFSILNKLIGLHYLNSFLLGLAFSFAWSPCFGPISASIYIFAGLAPTIWQALAILIIFSIGVAIPFIIFSLTLNYTWPYLLRFKKYFRWGQIIFALAILTIGILVLIGKWGLFIKN